MGVKFRNWLWWVTCGLSVVNLNAAQAQSAYTMTVLNRPLSVVGARPVALDNAGNVLGISSYVYKTTYEAGGIGSCWVCRHHRFQDIRWPASTTNSLTGTLGQKDFMLQAASPDGSWTVGALGETYVGSRNYDASVVPSPLVPPQSLYHNLVVRKGNTSTALRFVLIHASPQAIAINNQGVVVGEVAVVDSQGNGSGPIGFIHQSGTERPLPPANAERTEQQHPVGISNSNEVLATVFSLPRTFDYLEGQAYLWDARSSSRQDLAGGQPGYQALALNQSGQALLSHQPKDYTRPMGSALWSGGQLIEITGDMANGQSVLALALNDSGVVVGCLQPQNTSVAFPIYTPFIWRNGVMQNLNSYLSSKGLKLPTGTALGCPVAINNSGTMLAYTYKTGSGSFGNWVRLNASP